METIRMKWHFPFSGKNKKKSNLLSAGESAKRNL